MNDLRLLLIDCRIELRKLVRDFADSKLCQRLDLATQTLASVGDGADLDKTTPTSLRKIRETSNQVALAWQMAARDLKFSDPVLYAAMAQKVMTRLEAKTLVDQVDELRELESNLVQLRRQHADSEKARDTAEAERNTLLGALATAVPHLADGGDPIGVALARIDCLKAQAQRPAPSPAAAAQAEQDSRIPGSELIALVAAGARQFSSAQREWCVGEAMVLSGFEHTPMELIALGDARIAAIIVAARGGQ